MKQVLIFSILSILISISISVWPYGKQPSHPINFSGALKANKTKTCKNNQRSICDKKGKCFCAPRFKCGTPDLMKRLRFRNRTKIYGTADIKCQKGYRKCYYPHLKKYHCISNLLNATCISGPIKNKFHPSHHINK